MWAKVLNKLIVLCDADEKTSLVSIESRAELLCGRMLEKRSTKDKEETCSAHA